ncbi:DnaJ domain-containing protein, partial [bacterium]|nr:DnaJ domain-containing protein [candidate division CSSED10-310 bacterium]
RVGAMKDYYAILGVPRDAGQQDIKRAFRDKAKECHPDREHGCSDDFRAVREAYEVLGDSRRRRNYDRGGEAPARPVTGGRQRTRPVVTYDPGLADLVDMVQSLFFNRERRTVTSGGYDLEVVLDQREADTGVMIPVTVALQRRCPDCHGTGESCFTVCPRCRGHGTISAMATVRLTIPPATPSGVILAFTVQHYPLQVVRVLVRVN